MEVWSLQELVKPNTLLIWSAFESLSLCGVTVHLTGLILKTFFACPCQRTLGLFCGVHITRLLKRFHFCFFFCSFSRRHETSSLQLMRAEGRWKSDLCNLVLHLHCSFGLYVGYCPMQGREGCTEESGDKARRLEWEWHYFRLPPSPEIKRIFRKVHLT